MYVVRLLAISASVAAGWFALSLATSAPAAQASEGAVEWNWASDSQESKNLVSDIVNSVTKPVAPALDAVENIATTATATVADSVSHAPAKTPLGEVTGVVSEAVSSVAGHVDTLVGAVTTTLDDIVEDTLSGVVDGVVDSVADSDLPLIELVTIIDPADPEGAAFTALGTPNDEVSEATTIALQQLSDALWPLAPTPAPWSPRELVLISSGALTGSSSGSSSAPACDLPLVERWLAMNSTLADPSHSERVPGSPTYDTDSTPD